MRPSVPPARGPIGRSPLAREERRALGLAAIHLAVLWSFAVAQPLLDLLGDVPEFFVARGNGRDDILLLAFGLVLVPPLVLVALEAVASLVSPGLRRALHAVFMGVLAAAFVLQVLKKGPDAPDAVLIALALLTGGLLALLYRRAPAASTVLTVLAPAPLIFVAIFLLFSPVEQLVFNGTDVAVSDAARGTRIPVVMIVFDELSTIALLGRDGRVDAVRFPHFASLGRDADWYRNATTVADDTAEAVPAMLSGARPRPGQAPILSSHPKNLFALLGGSYSLDVTEPASDLCPVRLCPGEAAEREPLGRRLKRLWSDLHIVSLHLLLPDDLADRLPPVDRSFGDFKQFDAADSADDPGATARGFAAVGAFGRRIEEFHEFARRLGRPPRDAHLSFLHVFYPHQPYDHLPTGQRYPDVQTFPGLQSGVPAGRWPRDPAPAAQALRRYVLQLEHVDRLLGVALHRMRDSGLYDRALVVVAADHGVSFEPGAPFRSVHDSNIAQVAGIPLFIKSPRQREGRILDTNVTSADVLPTIASRLGIRLPWRLEGRPAEAARRDGVVTVKRAQADRPLSISFAEFLRRRAAASRAVLTSLARRPALYDTPVHDRLLGRAVATLGATPSSARFELDADGLFRSVEPRGPVVPSFVTGKVTGVPEGAQVAVTVNDRVAAVTATYAEDDAQRFAAMVPPGSFRKGTNDVRVVQILGRGAGRRFARLRGGARAYRLVRAGSQELLEDGEGHRITEVAAGAIRGAVDALNVDATELTIAGWAGRIRPPRPADWVLAFAGDRLISSVRPSQPRADLARLYGDGLGRAGFMIIGAADPAQASAGRRLRVFAILGDRAVRLPVPGGRLPAPPAP